MVFSLAKFGSSPRPIMDSTMDGSRPSRPSTKTFFFTLLSDVRVFGYSGRLGRRAVRRFGRFVRFEQIQEFSQDDEHLVPKNEQKGEHRRQSRGQGHQLVGATIQKCENGKRHLAPWGSGSS